VTFDIDANGILSVTAKDKATGKTQSVRIEGSASLSKEEIEKLKKEAEMYAEEDKKKRELAELKIMPKLSSIQLKKLSKRMERKYRLT